MITTDALPTRMTIRTERSVPSSLSILIEVPEVRLPEVLRDRTYMNGRQHGWRSVPRPRRRRLRREVRLAGCALLVFLPLAGTCMLGWQSVSNQLRAASIVDATASPRYWLNVRHRDQRNPACPVESTDAGSIDVPSEVVLSVEPAVVTPDSDREVPVIFPGYVLPDDSLEDSSHAGS